LPNQASDRVALLAHRYISLALANWASISVKHCL